MHSVQLAAELAKISVGDFRDKVGSLGNAIRQEVSRTLFPAADLIRVEAQISITTGAVSGKGHAPSKPGDPPNNDTGVLANNIETEQVGPLHARVRSSAPYAAMLEFGTSKMAERPYLRPAVQKARPEIDKALLAAGRRAIRKHFRS